MAQDTDKIAHETLESLLQPLARIMIDNGVGLGDAVEMLKSAMVAKATEKFPEASASQLSLTTGVHRKDIKRLASETPSRPNATAAARVLSIWQTDADFSKDGAPKILERRGNTGFDALVKRAKVDAAPATMLSVLIASGNVSVEGTRVAFQNAAMVPKEHGDRLKTAELTLRPHMETVAANLAGERAQWDQALRYSHLSKEAAQQLETEAAEMALEMLRKLNTLAQNLQANDEGNTLFVAGTFTHKSEQD